MRALTAKWPGCCVSPESMPRRRSPEMVNPVEPLDSTGFEPIADYLVIAMRCA